MATNSNTFRTMKPKTLQHKEKPTVTCYKGNTWNDNAITQLITTGRGPHSTDADRWTLRLINGGPIKGAEGVDTHLGRGEQTGTCTHQFTSSKLPVPPARCLQSGPTRSLAVLLPYPLHFIFCSLANLKININIVAFDLQDGLFAACVLRVPPPSPPACLFMWIPS